MHQWDKTHRMFLFFILLLAGEAAEQEEDNLMHDFASTSPVVCSGSRLQWRLHVPHPLGTFLPTNQHARAWPSHLSFYLIPSHSLQPIASHGHGTHVWFYLEISHKISWAETENFPEGSPEAVYPFIFIILKAERRVNNDRETPGTLWWWCVCVWGVGLGDECWSCFLLNIWKLTHS